MKTSNILFLLLLSTFSLQATTYYLDSSTGSNQNDGLTVATAWQDTFQRAIVPGDSVLFKRGGEWNRRWYFSVSATESQPIYIGAYGDISEPLPIISGILPIPNATDPDSWVNQSNNIWTLPMPNSPGRLFLDGQEHLRADTTMSVGELDAEGVRAEWYHIGGQLRLYATQNPATLYTQFEGSKYFIPFDFFATHHYKLQHLDIRGGSGAAIRIFSGQDIEISHCKIGNAATSGILLTYFHFKSDSTNRPCERISIHDNIFDSKFEFHYGAFPSNDSNRGCGDGIKLDDGIIDCSIYRNRFKNWAHNAIELEGLKDTVIGVNNNVFFDNYITAPDIPYAHPFGVDGVLGRCQFNEFYRNRIEYCNTASQINGNNNHVHHNIIAHARKSPAKSTVTAHAFLLAVYGTNLVSQNNTFEHNTIIDTDESGFLIRGDGFQNQVKDNIIRNNIIYNTGQAPLNNAYSAGTGLVIFDRNDGIDGNIYENNLFHSDSAAYQAVFMQIGSRYYTASDFSQLNGLDNDSISQNIDGDPLFKDVLLENYTLSATSPAIDKGINGSLLTDYLLNDRMLGDSVDIGAIESGTDCLADFQINNYPILNGTYEAQQTIISRALLLPTSEAIVRAGQSITLQPGFEAQNGSFLHLKVESCGAVVSVLDSEVHNRKKENVETAELVLSIAPNPIGQTNALNLMYSLAESGEVNIRLVDVNGRVVKTMYIGQQDAGQYRLDLSVTDLRVGIYYLKIQCGELTAQKIVVKN
ncbi:MAG: 3-coathanger stack domain-containing protein [Bacteroidota bacterium]